MTIDDTFAVSRAMNDVPSSPAKRFTPTVNVLLIEVQISVAAAADAIVALLATASSTATRVRVAFMVYGYRPIGEGAGCDSSKDVPPERVFAIAVRMKKP